MPNTLQKTLLSLLTIVFLFSCKTKSAKPDKKKDFAKEFSKPFVQENVFANNALFMEGINAATVSLQTFTINNAEKKWITAKKGFKVFIDPDKLCKKDGSKITGTIEVHIKEVTNTEEMMAANTPTMSDGRMLISGGSYFLSVSNNDEELSIKANQGLLIQLPNLKKNNMQLFYGSVMENGFVNWQPANRNFKKKTSVSSSFTKSYYNKNNRNDYYTVEVSNGTTIGKRPASLTECYNIYVDSTYKARWDYTRLHRDKMTHKEKMAYGLRPFVFPYDRFQKSLVRKEMKIKDDRRNNIKVYYEPGMYFVDDTIPLYKKDTVFPNERKDNIAKDELEYYEPSEITALGWINCDEFYNVPICKSTEIQLGGTEKITSCRVYYNFKKLNSLLAEQIYFKNGDTPQFTATTKLPLGEKVEIIVMAIQGGKLWSAKRSITISGENKIRFELTETDKGKLQSFVKQDS